MNRNQRVSRLTIAALLLVVSGDGVVGAGIPQKPAAPPVTELNSQRRGPIDKPPPQTSASDELARAQLRVATMYEHSGRFAEAEAALLKAIDQGSDPTRRAALAALDRLVLARESAGPARLIRVGDMYESEGRWTEAEAVYSKVLESGTSAMRTEAARRLQVVSGIRQGFWEKYVTPVADPIMTSAVAVALLLLFVIIGRYPVNAIGLRRGENALAISSFVQFTGAQAIGSTMIEILAETHERMTVHFRPRTVLRDRALPALLKSQSTELVDLVSAVSTPAVPIVSWWIRRLHQPAYRLSVWVESSEAHVRAVAKLEHAGTIVARWNRNFQVPDWFVGEQDLAYEILIRLKEYADGHAP